MCSDPAFGVTTVGGLSPPLASNCLESFSEYITTSVDIKISTILKAPLPWQYIHS